jgi:hypothetical protein
MIPTRRRYKVAVWSNSIHTREFVATSEEDAIAQARALFEERDIGPFEDCGLEVDKYTVEGSRPVDAN